MIIPVQVARRSIMINRRHVRGIGDVAPSLSFNTSRGGAALQPGDTWMVTITGAPNSPVAVLGNTAGNRTDSVKTPMGSTDAGGNFSKSGTITSNDLGTWVEQWSVADVPVGSFSFTVALPAAVAAAVTPPAGPVSSSGGGTPATSPPGFSFGSIPWWGWAAVVGGVFLFTRR